MTPEDFADHSLVRLLENLDPVGRSRVLASLTAEARDRLGVTAAANRRRQRDDLFVHLAAMIAPGASARRAAEDLEAAIRLYHSAGWRRGKLEHRPLTEPNRSLHRLLELTDGKIPAQRSIREKL